MRTKHAVSFGELRVTKAGTHIYVYVYIDIANTKNTLVIIYSMETMDYANMTDNY